MNKKYVQNAHATIPIEQSELWQTFDGAISNRRPLGFYAYMDGNKPLALFTMTLYTQRGYNWIWIKHGPVSLSNSVGVLDDNFTQMLKKFVSTKIRPKVCFVRLNLPLRTKGTSLPLHHTMYEKTVIIDLTKESEQIQSGMSQGGRRSLRQALKNQLQTTEAADISAETFRPYYNILEETASRDGFVVHPASLYLNLLAKLPHNARLFYVHPEKQPDNILAWAIVTVYQKRALYYYGASSSAARDLNAPYQLHWDIIQTLKEEGVKSYDFMGIASDNYPGLKNVSVFKQKFSKEVTEVTPTYDLVVQPIRYALLKLFYRIR